MYLHIIMNPNDLILCSEKLRPEPGRSLANILYMLYYFIDILSLILLCELKYR